MLLDVAFDGIVGQQLGEVALGHLQVEQIRAVVLLGVFVLGLCIWLISFSSLTICSIVRPEQLSFSKRAPLDRLQLQRY